MAQYTQSELRVGKNDKEVLFLSGGEYFGYTHKPEDAARLALCWNMHDELVAALTRIADIAKDWEICDGRKNIQLEHSDSYKAARAALAKLDGAK